MPRIGGVPVVGIELVLKLKLEVKQIDTQDTFQFVLCRNAMHNTFFT